MLIILLVILLVLGLLVISSYNRLVRLRNGAEEAFKSINVYLKQRYDLIPNLVNTIKGYTQYESGTLESQREMHDNKKHGLFFAWFQEGDLMLMEEYENDLLIKGSYYKKWEKKPISKIENGSGLATIFDKEGKFLKKITYEKGLPQKES